MDWSSSKLPDRLPERLPFSKKRLPKRVIFSYILDYVIIAALIVAFSIVDKIEPFHQPFSMENYTLHYPFATKERIPVFELCLYVIAAPAAIIAIYTLVIDGLFSHQTPMPAENKGVRRLSGRYRLKDRLWELNCGILGLGLSVMLAFTITGALKNAIGKPRPDLIDRCKVRDDWENTKIAGDPRWPLRTIEICTQKDNAILQDGFKSFPSGHSSTAFAGLFYLSLYLAAKLHILDSKGEVWKAFVVMVPTLGACLVAGSRIMDARHHPFDVISGGLVGIIVAWLSYRQYFPPISETWKKGRAYPIRSWGRQPQPPQYPRIQIDEDTEPLRPIRQPSDVEAQAASSGFTSQTALAGAGAGAGTNVFRQQISQSQRQRQEEAQEYGLQHSDTLDSTLSGKVAGYRGQMPSQNPYLGNPRRHDTYDYSSSEEEDSYELQQTYNNLSHPQRDPVYNPVSGTLQDTGYHRPAGASPTPTPPPPANVGGARPFPTTGDIAESRTQPQRAPGAI